MTAIRSAWGALLLLAPGLILDRLPAQPDAGRVRDIARILGLRHLVQAAIVARRPTRAAILVGAAVDGAHATSMVALAVLRPDHRTLALADAVIASTFAAAGVGEAGGCGDLRVRSDRRERRTPCEPAIDRALPRSLDEKRLCRRRRPLAGDVSRRFAARAAGPPVARGG